MAKYTCKTMTLALAQESPVAGVLKPERGGRKKAPLKGGRSMIEVHICVAMALMPALVFGTLFFLGWALQIVGWFMDYTYRKGVERGWWKDNYPE
ncbi:MAG: hypothetical protein ACYSW6_04900 [Planctomycetota bacterium]